MAEQLTLNQLVGSSSLPRLTSILSTKEPVRATRDGLSDSGRTPFRTPLSRRGSPADDGIGPIGGSPEHRIGQVAVHVGRRRYRGVAEDARHDGELLTLLEAERCARMAQIMEPLARQRGRRERRLEPVRDVGRVERSPGRGGEHVVAIVPASTRRQPFLPLPAAMLTEAGEKLDAEA